MLKKYTLFSLLALMLSVALATYFGIQLKLTNERQNRTLTSMVNPLVDIDITPKLEYQFDIMSEGVLQHIDRPYTYDIIPEDLRGGTLFRSIHEVPKGTTIRFKILSPSQVYFFFCHGQDGGYSEIFELLPGWKRREDFPQYDIYNGSHGLIMTMFSFNAAPGIYEIPETTKKGACFNIVFRE